VALGVPGRLRPRIVMTFCTTSVVLPPLPQEKSLVLMFIAHDFVGRNHGKYPQ